jgi:short subunit dehydrogenase-like uncharacterized protein
VIGDDRLDIVLYGATGFVGRLTAAYLAEHAGPDVRIGLAGRSELRLAALRRQLPHTAANWPLIEADAEDPASLAELAARARVVATTVGPYAKWGLPLVEACASAGVHYCDLTGEVLFVRESADTLHQTAQDSGARIVHSCGFDSIPSDLGVLVTADRVAADHEGQLTTTTLSVQTMKGGFSGGTIDSMRVQAISAREDQAARAILADPYSLSPDRAAEPSSSARETDTVAPPAGLVARYTRTARGLIRQVPIRRDPQTGRWTAPFVMAGFNTRIVRRSNALLGWRYGRDFRYREVTDFGSGPTAPMLAGGLTAGMMGLAVGMSFEPSRAVLRRVLPKPGEGPDAATRAKGRFHMVITTLTTTGAAYRTTVGAQYDPGYNGTAVMLGESALCLAFDGERLPAVAGVLTPATAMGEVLVDRLRAQGFTFRCERV